MLLTSGPPRGFTTRALLAVCPFCSFIRGKMAAIFDQVTFNPIVLIAKTFYLKFDVL